MNIFIVTSLFLSFVVSKGYEDLKYFDISDAANNKYSLQFTNLNGGSYPCTIKVTGKESGISNMLPRQDCSELPIIFRLRNQEEYLHVEIKSYYFTIFNDTTHVNSKVFVDTIGGIVYVDPQSAKLSKTSTCQISLINSKKERVDINTICSLKYDDDYYNDESCIKSCRPFAITNLTQNENYILSITVDDKITRNKPILVTSFKENVFVDIFGKKVYVSVSDNSRDGCIFKLKNGVTIIKESKLNCFGGFIIPDDISFDHLTVTVTKDSEEINSIKITENNFDTFPTDVKYMLWIKNTLIVDFICKTEGERCLYNYEIRDMDTMELFYYCYHSNFCMRFGGRIEFPNLDRSKNYMIYFLSSKKNYRRLYNAEISSYSYSITRIIEDAKSLDMKRKNDE